MSGTTTVGKAVYEVEVDESGVKPGLAAAEKALQQSGAVAEDAFGKRAKAALDSLSTSVQKTGTDAQDAFGKKATGALGQLTGAVDGIRSKFSGMAEQGGLTGFLVGGVGLKVGMGLVDMATSAVTGFVANIGNAIDLASDKAEAASKANVIFGDSYRIIEERSKTAADTVGVSSGKYLEAAGNVGNLLTNFGIAGDEAANMSGDIIQLAADMGSFNNASTEDVTEAIGAAFRGETEPIRKFGVMLDAATVSAKAVKMGLADSTQAVSAQDKALATYNLILEQTGTAQGDFARTADGFANDQRINAAKQEEAWTRIGEAIKPLAQGLGDLVSGAMTGMLDMVGNVASGIGDWIDNNQELLTNIGNLIHDGVDALMGVLGGLWDFIKGPLGTALDLLGKGFEIAGKTIGIFIDAIKFGVDALHNLHRAIDPNMAAIEDVKTKFSEAATAAGLSGEEVERAWTKAMEATQNGTVDTGQSLDEFIADFKAAGTATHDDFASRVGESQTDVVNMVAAMEQGAKDHLVSLEGAYTDFGLRVPGEVQPVGIAMQGVADDTGQAAADVAEAIGQLPPEFQAFAQDAGLSVDQINEMAKSMPKVWGPELVELKAALDQLPPELRDVAQKSGMSVEQINEWVASLPPEARAAAKGVDAAAADITASIDDITGALSGLGTGSDSAWKQFKDGTKDGAGDVEKRIERLQTRLTTLNEVDLAKLGPQSLAAWASARDATQTELGGLLQFVDNKSTIIEDLLPDALKQSNKDVDAQWTKLTGSTTSTFKDIGDFVSDRSDRIGDELPDALEDSAADTKRHLSTTKTNVETTYSSIATTAGDKSDDAAAQLPASLRGSLNALGSAMQAVNSVLNGVWSAIAAAAGVWGGRTGRAFGDGLSSTTWYIREAAQRALAGAKAVLEAHSPPGPASPLHHVGDWAENTAHEYVNRLNRVFAAAQLPNVRNVQVALAGSAAGLRDSAAMTGGPRPGRLESAALRPAGGASVVEVHHAPEYHFHIGTLVADNMGLAQLGRRIREEVSYSERSRYPLHMPRGA